MHCVPADCPKKLSQAMRIASGTPVGDAETASTMPYAIIADDNVEVLTSLNIFVGLHLFQSLESR